MTPVVYLGHEAGGAQHGLSGATLATFRQQSEAVYLQLRQSHAELTGVVEWRSVLVPDSVAGAWKSALDSVVDTLRQLGPAGTLTLRVVNGDATAGAWQELADTAAETLRYVAKETGEAIPTFGRVAREILAPSAAELVAEVKDAAGVAKEMLPWVVVGVVAVLVGYILLTLRR